MLPSDTLQGYVVRLLTRVALTTVLRGVSLRRQNIVSITLRHPWPKRTLSTF